jgi:hypothetical protein
MTEMQSSPTQLMAPEVNDGEGAGPSGRGAAPRSSEAPGPAHGERGGVRRLSTDGVVENRGECGGDGLPEADRRPIVSTTSKTEGSFYCHASRGSNTGLRKERGREVIVQCNTHFFYKNKIFVHIGVHIKCISNCSTYEKLSKNKSCIGCIA